MLVQQKLRNIKKAGFVKSTSTHQRGSVVDLFCGAGGLSHGFYLEGYKIAAGIDIDDECRYAFESNNDAEFIAKDIAEISSKEISKKFKLGEPKILVGCAPCQPFSGYSKGREDTRWNLLENFSRIIKEVRPDIVSMENVTGLIKFKEGKVFDKFIRNLYKCNYKVSWMKAYCPDFGVPQSRTRLVLIASLHGEPKMIQKTHTPDKYLTVKNAIGKMPKLKNGEVNKKDPLHKCSELSDINIKRIRASKPGGSWTDWPKNLVAACHKKQGGKSYQSVYGRMHWAKPAPTITTQFIGFGNGRFGHPEQDRAISIREGAIFQTFPSDYNFVAPDKKISTGILARLIGNAVPVELGRAIALAVSQHIKEYDL